MTGFEFMVVAGIAFAAIGEVASLATSPIKGWF